MSDEAVQILALFPLLALAAFAAWRGWQRVEAARWRREAKRVEDRISEVVPADRCLRCWDTGRVLCCGEFGEDRKITLRFAPCPECGGSGCCGGAA